MTNLTTFLATHQTTLTSLLGYWPVQVWKEEQFGPLTKYTLGQMPDGRWAMLHHIRAVDTGLPHCHPCRMDSYRFQSYVERLFFPGGRTEEVLREAGSSHTIEPDCIHLLVGLPEGEAWTLVFAGPVVREWRHYSEEELRSTEPTQPHSKYHTAVSDAVYSG